MILNKCTYMYDMIFDKFITTDEKLHDKNITNHIRLRSANISYLFDQSAFNLRPQLRCSDIIQVCISGGEARELCPPTPPPSTPQSEPPSNEHVLSCWHLRKPSWFRVNGWPINLTHISLPSIVRDIGKQYSPRWDAAECGIPSGATLFDKRNFIEKWNQKFKITFDGPNNESGLNQMITMGKSIRHKRVNAIWPKSTTSHGHIRTVSVPSHIVHGKISVGHTLLTRHAFSTKCTFKSTVTDKCYSWNTGESEWLW